MAGKCVVRDPLAVLSGRGGVQNPGAQQAMPANTLQNEQGLQPRSVGHEGKGGLWSSCLLCSRGIAMTSPWLLPLLNTSLRAIPVNPLGHPWELLGVRAKIPLISYCCVFLAGAYSSPAGH